MVLAFIDTTLVLSPDFLISISHRPNDLTNLPGMLEPLYESSPMFVYPSAP
jgi:hypothetical protein